MSLRCLSQFTSLPFPIAWECIGGEKICVCLAMSCLWQLVFKDGVTVRSIFALATPLVPLLLLIACGFLELFSRGLGGFIAIDQVQFARNIGAPFELVAVLGANHVQTQILATQQFPSFVSSKFERCPMVQSTDGVSPRTIVNDCQVAGASRFFCFRHSHGAEDAHGAFHWWCFRKRSAFGLPTNRWCRRLIQRPTVDFNFAMYKHYKSQGQLIRIHKINFIDHKS